MNEGDRPDAAGIDSRLDRRDNSEPQIDAAVYTAAKTFGVVALPLHITFAQAAAIEMQANMARNLDGAENFIMGASGNGPNDGLTAEQRQKRKDDDAWGYLATVAEESQRRERREREEWSRTPSTVGGVTKTGEEWAQLAERLRSDGDLRRRLIEAFEARGMSEDEAEARYERVADVAKIASIPEGQRTEEQTAKFEKAQADPTFSRDMATVQAKLDRKAEAAPSSALRDDFDRAGQAGGSPLEDPPAPAMAQKPITIATGPGF